VSFDGLTLKRQKASTPYPIRDGLTYLSPSISRRTQMTNLGRVITEIQRDAADTPTHELRSDIEVGLEVLDAAIIQLHALRPGADVTERISATADVMETVVTIALFVRELAKRPVDDPSPVIITRS
jgi:hypothetical protein